MAANPNKISTFNLPADGKVVDSEWKDDIDVEFAIYGGNEKQEGKYISPNTVVSKNAQKKIDRIKAKKIGITTLEVLSDQLQAA